MVVMFICVVRISTNGWHLYQRRKEKRSMKDTCKLSSTNTVLDGLKGTVVKVIPNEGKTYLLIKVG